MTAAATKNKTQIQALPKTMLAMTNDMVELSFGVDEWVSVCGCVSHNLG